MTTIAVIGAGAMGSGVGRRLHENGARVLTLLEGRSEASRERAVSAGMEAASLDEIATAGLIVSIVPPAQAANVVETLGPVFSSASPPLFCDANALAPETKRQLAARVAKLGGRMVDGAIIGGPPAADYDGPRLYLCGEGAEEVARLNRYGIETRVLAGPQGAAATLKMCYGGINKGVIGLVTALLLAARRHGADEDLLAEMAISQKELLGRHAKAIPSMYPRAYRWDAEMHEIAGFLASEDPAAAEIWDGLGKFYADRAAAYEACDELEALKKLLS